MAQKAKSPLLKIATVIVVLLAIGGFIASKGVKKDGGKRPNLNQLEDEIVDLAPQIDANVEQITKLADQKKLTEATTTGNDILDTIDTILANHDVLLENVSSKDKQSLEERQDYFEVYREVVVKMMECIQYKTDSPRVKKCKNEYAEIVARMQKELNEYNAVRGQ